ncbi:hypothetical protein A1D31_35145, partial [Bradyrhizobium liaoningense]
MADSSASKIVAFPANRDDARRVQNKHNAIFLARNGIPVFPSSGKIPLVKLYNRRDTEISPEDREAAIEQAREEGNKSLTVFVGATTDPDIVKRMWRAPNWDAVPSIACGPARLVVIDADIKFNGPELIAKLFEEHGGVPEGVQVITTQSGGKHYIFSDPDNAFTNSTGALKRLYGCDVRGRGGQFVAPGSVREDGKRYGDQAALRAFVDAYTNGSIPPLPDYIVELIGSPSSELSDDIAPSKEREVVKQLDRANVPDWEELCTPLGEYDFDKLQAENGEFRSLYSDPSADCSDNRFKAARHVMREWPEMPVEHLASFFSGWDGAGEFVDGKPRSGEYDNRQTAREWLKNQGLSKSSTGEAFGAVVDEDDSREGVQSDSKASRLGSRFTYIESLRGIVLDALDWCVKYFVARGTTSVATGLWGTGKTAVFSDIGLHVGHGFDWRGRKVAKGVVIYVALENSQDVERRVATWCDTMEKDGRDLSGGAFVVYRGPCRLYDPSGKPTQDERDLIKVANMAAAHYGLPVAMIVIDTLAQSIMPGNDNDAKDAGIYTAAMQRIVAATGANVTALAHPTKSGEGVRGSGALQANVDTVTEIAKDARGLGTIKAGSKYRIGNPAKVNFRYRLQSHTVGVDEDGDEISVVLADDLPVLDLAVDDTEEAQVPPSTDTPADKLAATLRVFTERVEAIAADTGERVGEIGLSKKMVLDALNVDRKRRGLVEIKDPTVVTRLLAKLVDSGEGDVPIAVELRRADVAGTNDYAA